MKDYTIIWVNSWMSGSHRHSITMKTFIRANSVEDVMKSDYGDAIVYFFEGFIPTLGEEITEDSIKTIN